MSRIVPLQPDAIKQVQSSKQITSLQGVVLSLLENSLDAGSSKIDIKVDFRRGGCTVQDNGMGIASAEFLDDGGLGKMYHTSKHGFAAAEPLHGTSGTFLASLAALSLLSVMSCRNEQEGCATLTVHQGKAIARQAPQLPPSDMLHSWSRGTTVTVKDLFGNMPVRVKQRALTADDSTKDQKLWSELKRGISALLVAWYRPCSVRLRDCETDGKIIHLSAEHSAVSDALTEKTIKALNGRSTKFDVRDTLSVLHQAGLTPAESRSTWVSVSASSSRISIRGAINLQPAPTKQSQFISIGIRPCNSDAAHGDFYEAVNKVFINSSFGCVKDGSAPIDDEEKDRRKRDRRYRNDGYTQKQLHGAKGVDKWPMFVLQISMLNQGLDPEKVNDTSLKAIVDVLEATVTQWLEAHHFRPRKRGRRKNKEQTAFAASSSSPANSRSRLQTPGGTVRSGLSTPGFNGTPTTESATTSKRRKYVDIEGNLRRLDHNRPASAPRPGNDFSSWSRIKSGRQNFYDQSWQVEARADAPGDTPAKKEPVMQHYKAALSLPSLDVGALSKMPREASTPLALPSVSTKTPRPAIQMTGVCSSSDDYGSIDVEDFTTAAEAVEHTYHAAHPYNGSNSAATADETVEWTDPITKQVFRVNARTGVVLPAPPHELQTANTSPAVQRDVSRPHSAAINTSLTSTGQPLSLSRRPRTAQNGGETAWLPGFLNQWDNPVFTRQSEESILITSIDGPGVDAAELMEKRCTHHDHTQAFSDIGSAGSAKLTKTALQTTRVVRQVDRKFILCRTQAGGADLQGELMVLVDQHAASERVILERLFAELCSPAEDSSGSGVRTTFLDKPLSFEVSATEHRVLERDTRRFAEWGILYSLQQKQDGMSASQVRAPEDKHLVIVKSLPPGIAERCAQFPKLIIDLLRTEIWSDATTNKTSALSSVEVDGEHSWLKRLGSCPKGLIDMLNSRACRSAIMFNDELSLAECEQLLADLSTCAFPFMCAHGRVSMVPLVEIGGGASEGGVFDGQQKEAEFGTAFARWQRGSE